MLPKKTKRIFTGTGCHLCNNTGYHGRVVIDEVLVVDEEIRQAILCKASANEIKQIAIKNGMTTMLLDGFDKVASGITTIEEILRMVYE